MTSLKEGVRGWSIALVAVVAGALLAGCGQAATSAASSGLPAAADTILGMPDLKGQTIVVNTYGGSWADAVTKDVVTPFEQTTGAKIVLSKNCCDAFDQQVKQNQFAGDVVLGDTYGIMLAWAKNGLMKDDPKLEQIAKGYGIAANNYTSGVVSAGSGAYVIAWNTKYNDNHPTSWSEFFDTTTFTGVRGVPSQPYGTLDVAALAGGTDPRNLYPLDVTKALDTLTRLDQATKVHYWTGGADLQNQLGTGGTAYAIASSNRVIQSIQQGLPVDFSFNDSPEFTIGIGMPATVKNQSGALAFIDYYLSPSVQSKFAADSGLSPPYAAATALVDKSILRYMSTSPENTSKIVPVDNNWWLDNSAAATQQFANWQVHH